MIDWSAKHADDEIHAQTSNGCWGSLRTSLALRGLNSLGWQDRRSNPRCLVRHRHPRKQSGQSEVRLNLLSLTNLMMKPPTCPGATSAIGCSATMLLDTRLKPHTDVAPRRIQTERRWRPLRSGVTFSGISRTLRKFLV
jgi:hypothetical protein